MEMLDLAAHEPEEYEGKVVVCHGAEYVIGPHLGTGAEKIVHRLINRRSGLAMLVIKVLRQQRPKGMVPSILAKLRTDQKLAKLVTITHEVDIPGGMAELQPYVGGGPPVQDPFDGELDAGLTALEGQDFVRAAACFECVLAGNAAHTMAMINLAATAHGQGETGRAAKLARDAVAIEPNLFLYRQALVQYTAETGMIKIALADFRDTKQVFAHVHDLNEIAISLYLHVGEPQAAQALLSDAMVDDAKRTELSAQVASDVAAQARAAQWMAAARADVEGENMAAALAALRTAHAAYDKDRLLNINLALALARAGEPGAAVGLLVEAAAVVDDWGVPVCWANAAWCLVDAGKLSSSLVALEALANVLTIRHRGPLPTNPADLPGIAIWIDADQMIEERLNTAVSRIERALAGVTDGRPASETVRSLAEAYRQASRSG